MQCPCNAFHRQKAARQSNCIDYPVFHVLTYGVFKQKWFY
jgi:hypothetical protein